MIIETFDKQVSNVKKVFLEEEALPLWWEQSLVNEEGG